MAKIKDLDGGAESKQGHRVKIGQGQKWGGMGLGYVFGESRKEKK